MMRYNLIRREDISNGPGIRVSIFVQGCSRHCKGCFNKETWAWNKGHYFTEERLHQFLALGKPNKISGFSILGGEPLEQGNSMLELVQAIKKEFPEKSIWMWTGYTLEEIAKENWLKLEILKYIDVLIDGHFIEEKKNLNLKWKGSSNQRIIDVQKSLKREKIILYKMED